MSRIKATVCSLLIVFLFVGCGQQVTGTWTLHSMEQNGVLTEGDELDAIYGGTIEYVFKSDGTLIVKMMGQEVEGVWEQKEDIVTITYNDLVSELTKNGDELILEQNGITFTIVRE